MGSTGPAAASIAKEVTMNAESWKNISDVCKWMIFHLFVGFQWTMEDFYTFGRRLLTIFANHRSLFTHSLPYLLCLSP